MAEVINSVGFSVITLNANLLSIVPVSFILWPDDSYHAETQSWKTPRSPRNVHTHAFAVLPPPPALLICVLQPPSALVRRKRSCPALAVGLHQLEKAFDVWGTICDGGGLVMMLFQ